MEKGKVTRRDFLRITAVAVTSGALAACGTAPPAGTTTQPTTAASAAAGNAAPTAPAIATADASVAEKPASPDTKTIEWWPGWPGPYMLAVAKLFEDKHEGVKVNAGLFYPEQSKLLASLAAGTAPDIVADVAYLELIARGVCLPLDEFIAGSKDVSLTDGDIRKDHWEVFSWKGKHYGVPSVDTAGREGLGINLDVAKNAGLDTSKLPETWDEVFEWHKKITKYDDAGNLEILGMDPMAERVDATSYGDPWMMPESWGFHYIDEDMKYHIDRPETVEFLSVIKKFSDDVGVEKLAGLSSAMEGISRGAFGVGKQAMQITYPSGPASVWKTNPTQSYKWTYVPVPASRKGKKVQTFGGHAGIIMKDAKLPEEAFALAVFLTQKDACDVLFDQVGWLGPRKSWQKQVDLDKYPAPVQENMLFYTKSLDEADEIWYERDPIESITQDAWKQAWDGVIHGSITPADAAKKMQAKLDDELKKALEDNG